MRTRFPGLSYIPGLVRSCASYPQPNCTNLTQASLSTDSARNLLWQEGKEERKSLALGRAFLRA
jgi:hypothetical protein